MNYAVKAPAKPKVKKINTKKVKKEEPTSNHLNSQISNPVSNPEEKAMSRKVGLTSEMKTNKDS